MPIMIQTDLDQIRILIRECFENTPFSPLLEDPASLLSNQGKMLRSRLAIRLGIANAVEQERLIRTGAAIELLHTASLLHDDIIDNGHLRRHATTYWQKHGIPGAILLGDLLMFYAMKLLIPLQNQRLSEALIQFAGEVGEAEVKQEIILRGEPQTWSECVETARTKTGPLFAFMGYVAGGDCGRLSATLSECGYLIGTAYQLADDLWDAHGDPEQADKTLDRDKERNKKTVANACIEAHIDPKQYINQLCQTAQGQLADTPHLQQAVQDYLSEDLQPALDLFLQQNPHTS